MFHLYNQKYFLLTTQQKLENITMIKNKEQKEGKTRHKKS